MATLNDFNKVDGTTVVIAAHINDLISATMRAEYNNVETLSGTRTLLDVDTPIQRFDCNGSARTVLMPVGDTTDNHQFWIVNSSGSGEIITLRNNGNTTTLGTIDDGEAALMIPDGNGGYIKVGGDLPAPTTDTYVALTQTLVYDSDATWTKATYPDLYAIRVRLVGGGGGGGGIDSATSAGGQGGPGGGGEYAEKYILAAALGATEAVTVADGGAGGAAGANAGATGESSSFGSHVSVNGGAPGAGMTATTTFPALCGAGGAGGSGGTGGDIHIAGSMGITGIVLAVSSSTPGLGGGSVLGGLTGLTSGLASDSDGAVGKLYGSGGTGARSSNTATDYAGGAGAKGVVLVDIYQTITA